MQQRYLDPAILAGISGIDLVAKTVVEGFVNGLHRSPDFGFSQEFAEYRMYTPGDDLRHVDWNVYARTERCYLKRYKGETNTMVTILIDASASMSYSSLPASKLEYAKFLASSLAYLASKQRDSSGLIVFDDEVRNSSPHRLARATYTASYMPSNAPCPASVPTTPSRSSTSNNFSRGAELWP